MASARFKELIKKYGKVGLGVHFSVSGASLAGLYAAIKTNVDVESLFHKIGIRGISTTSPQNQNSDTFDPTDDDAVAVVKKRNRTAEIAASSGGALMMAVLCNKALFPVRLPITFLLTPPIARFLARRQIIKNAAL